MACGCGGGNGGQGGCGGQQPAVDVAVNAPAVKEVVPEPVPTADEPEADAEEVPELIATSAQEWPRVKVNGVAIAPEAIALELQYHPADSRNEAVYYATRALVIRELLQQRINALGLLVRPQPGESEEEAATRALIEQEVQLPSADDNACRQYYAGNQSRFHSAPLLAARHILLACPGDDEVARSETRERAEALIGELQADGSRFAELAMAHSACPSKEQGGALGQLSKGQTVPEFERQLFRLAEGLAAQPLETRYGYHIVWVDQRIDGRQLPYEAVAEKIRDELNQRVWQVGVAQYLKSLVGVADIQGIHLEGADSPLMQ